MAGRHRATGDDMPVVRLCVRVAPSGEDPTVDHSAVRAVLYEAAGAGAARRDRRRTAATRSGTMGG